MANVGTLAQPLTRAKYLAGSTGTTVSPLNLFALRSTAAVADGAVHGIQRHGSAADGRCLQSMNAGAQFPPITSVAGGAILCTGTQTTPYALSPEPLPDFSRYNGTAASNARMVAFQQLTHAPFGSFTRSGHRLGDELFTAAERHAGQRAQDPACLANHVPNHKYWRAIETGGADHPGALVPRAAAADLLLLARRV